MKVLFLHGQHSAPGGVQPTYLMDHGHTVINPTLDDDDFEAAVRTAQAEFDRHQPAVIVGCSRGGAVAMNMNCGAAHLVLLRPAWKHWGTAKTVRADTVILHSRADEAIPFADSEELSRRSGAPLIEVGDDPRLAGPVTLQRMLGAVELAGPTLCLGIDVTWWGGSPRRRDSQRDTIVYAVVQTGASAELKFSLVNLSAAPNPGASPTEANFDPEGELLVKRVATILEENKGRFQRCVVALDAPLEARHRENQPPRVKAVDAGKETGSKRRECEEAIQRYKELANGKDARAWHSDLHIQSGSPVAPRIASILRRLESEFGFVCWGMERRRHDRQVIEIFPSEAIWALGLHNGFPNQNPREVRHYKQKNPSTLLRAAAREAAIKPLLGFVERFGSQVGLPLLRWCEQVAEYSCNIAADRKKAEEVRKGKGFDDPVESGLAFLTAMTFVGGMSHAWGDGTDGTIVGPGTFAAMTNRRSQGKRAAIRP